MALISNSKTVTLDSNGVLSFTQEGDYSFNYLNNKVQILLEDGQTTNLSTSQYDGIKKLSIGAGAKVTISAVELVGLEILGTTGSLNITGLTFSEAGPDGSFETSVNLDTVLGSMIANRGIAATVAALGGGADAFKMLWDYLDDAYVAGNNYYDLPLNENFVRLGVEYARYLDAGGEPLIDVIGKYAADTDGDGIPQRSQSLHDNLLGNLDTATVNDRFGANPTLLAELKALIPDAYEVRGVFSGNQSDLGGAGHDSVRAFDYDRGWNRPDYIEHAFGKVDALASDDRNLDGIDEQMFYGTGNSNDAFNIVRHEGAGVELALKAKEFGPNGGDYSAANVEVVDGIAHYNVSTGVSPDNAARADWSFDWAATVLPHGTDDAFTFKLKIDTDASEGVNLIEIPVAPLATGPGAGLVQGSTNIAFGSILSQIDADPNQDGVQPYAFGPGEFNVALEAWDGGTLIADNHIVAHVGGVGWDTGWDFA